MYLLNAELRQKLDCWWRKLHFRCTMDQIYWKDFIVSDVVVDLAEYFKKFSLLWSREYSGNVKLFSFLAERDISYSRNSPLWNPLMENSIDVHRIGAAPSIFLASFYRKVRVEEKIMKFSEKLSIIHRGRGSRLRNFWDIILNFSGI